MKVLKLAPLLLLILVLTGCSLGLDGIEVSKGKLEKPEQMLVSFTDAQAFSLKDGRILVYGKGFRSDESKYPYSQENAPWQIFDPISKTYSLTGAPHLSIDGEVPVMLADGRVLLTGGGIWDTTARTEIYNVATGQFSFGPNMLHPRAKHSATLLKDGSVLIAGGQYNSSKGKITVIKEAEIYDPKRNKFYPTGPMTEQLGKAKDSFLGLFSSPFVIITRWACAYCLAKNL